MINHIGDFTCCSNDQDCEEIREYHECQYLYNEYLCNTYRIKLTSAVPHSTDPDKLVVTFKFIGMNMLFKGNVNWTITPSTGWTCEGCDILPPGENSIIVVTFDNAEFFPDEDNSDFSISAEATTIECGSISDEYEAPIVEGLVVTTGDCNELKTEIVASLDVEGNSYSWFFFGYDNFVTTSSDYKTNTFDTDEIITRYNELNSQTNTELPRVLPYELNIDNNLDDTQDRQLYGYVEIPTCVGPGFLNVYPNPTTETIQIKLSGGITKSIQVEQDATSLQEYFIVNSRSQTVKKGAINSVEETINILDLSSGVYYIYLITPSGQFISNKFIVIR